MTPGSPRKAHQDLQHSAIAGSGHHEAEGVLLQLHPVAGGGGRGSLERLHVLVRDLEPLSVRVSDLHTWTQHSVGPLINPQYRHLPAFSTVLTQGISTIIPVFSSAFIVIHIQV